MSHQRQSVWVCCTLSMLLLLCSCSLGTPTENQEADTEIIQGYTDEDYEELAVASVETSLKDRLKNPESLQIHNTTIVGDSYEDDSDYFCEITIDYSAQNGFGGYNRDTITAYIKIAKATGTVMELSEASYINQRAEAQFIDGVSSIGGDIPLQFIFSEDNYSRILPNIKGNGKTSFTYPSGDKEVRYISKLGDLEGVATFYFYAGSEKIHQISFYWSDGQSFYDGTDAYTLGSERIATLEDVDALKDGINDTLNVSHGRVKESTETYFHDYECCWDLANGIYIKLSWTVHDGDNAIGHIQLLLCNEINGTVE